MTIDPKYTFSYVSIFLTSVYFLLDLSNRILFSYTLSDNSVVVAVILVYPLPLSYYTCYETALLTFSLLVIRYLLFITIYHRLCVLWFVAAYSGVSRHVLLRNHFNGYQSITTYFCEGTDNLLLSTATRTSGYYSGCIERNLW
jgi:hypothetical protein